MNIIEADNLKYSYPDAESFAVDGVSFTIEDGTFAAVLGHNGSGKSTLAKLLNGILLPAEGRVLVSGMDTADEKSAYDIKRTCATVFQNPDNQIVANVVEDDVAFALENMGVPPDEMRRRVDAALASVGMSGYAKAAPHLLSGGQKQRVAIAGILAMRPKCILLDESTSMLDPRGRREVVETVRRLNKENGITVILITHHMNEAALADRVIIMNKGKIAADGKPRKIFADEKKLAELSLDAPQTVKLAAKLKSFGIDIGCVPLDENECAAAICRAAAGIRKAEYAFASELA